MPSAISLALDCRVFWGTRGQGQRRGQAGPRGWGQEPWHGGSVPVEACCVCETGSKQELWRKTKPRPPPQFYLTLPSATADTAIPHRRVRGIGPKGVRVGVRVTETETKTDPHLRLFGLLHHLLHGADHSCSQFWQMGAHQRCCLLQPEQARLITQIGLVSLIKKKQEQNRTA